MKVNLIDFGLVLMLLAMTAAVSWGVPTLVVQFYNDGAYYD